MSVNVFSRVNKYTILNRQEVTNEEPPQIKTPLPTNLFMSFCTRKYYVYDGKCPLKIFSGYFDTLEILNVRKAKWKSR